MRTIKSLNQNGKHRRLDAIKRPDDIQQPKINGFMTKQTTTNSTPSQVWESQETRKSSLTKDKR